MLTIKPSRFIIILLGDPNIMSFTLQFKILFSFKEVATLNSRLTPSTQDYLEVILKLSDEERHVRITDIANSLNITKASVTETIDLLIEHKLVTKEKYGPVTLTPKGILEAKKVKKMHKVIYEFLIQSLNVTPETADKDACMIEHIISDETITKMIDFLEKTNQSCAININLNLKKARILLNSGGKLK